MRSPKPIGHWLKHLDNLLERQFTAVLLDLGLGRRHWQVLNTLHRGETTPDDLATTLAPFRTPAGPDLDGVLAELQARNWTTSGTRTLALTDTGRAAHQHIAARVAATRATLTTGLTPEEYAETVRVLSVMAHNVEADLAARAGRDDDELAGRDDELAVAHRRGRNHPAT